MDQTAVVQEEKKIGYREVFTQKEYLKIILSNIISRFGDSVDSIAFTWLVYQVTGSAAWSAIIFAMNQLPSVFIQPFAGALVEGMNKKRVMVVADVIRGIVVAGLGILFLLGAVNPWILVAFTLIISTVEAFCNPAGMAAIPKLIKPEYYEYGSSLNSTISSVVQLVGLGAAGLIIGVFGIWSAIMIDAITFFGSAAILATLRMKEENLLKGKLDGKQYLELLKEGAIYLKEEPVVRNFCLMAVVLNAIVVPLNSLQSPIVSEVFGQGSELLSVFGVALIAGMGVGSFCYPFLSKKISARGLIVLGGIGVGIMMGSVYFGTYTKGNKVAAYVMVAVVFFLFGIFCSMMTATVNVQFMKVVKQDYLARVGAIFNSAACAASPVASFLVSALVVKIPTGQLLALSGVLCVILFLYIAIRKVRFE
ncbi:MAG: MFS transporter [Roseburia sp.]